MTSQSVKTPLAQFVDAHLDMINQQLLDRLPPKHTSGERLHAAMQYSVLNGGKRIRPLLVLAAAQACDSCVSGDDPESFSETTWRAAVAIEYMHAYSLIHDDLPAMDDDDLRRGQPTCHIAFDYATAILAGDALQCAAFECLAASPETLPLIAPFAKASGANGMVLGQAIDLAAVNQTLTLDQLTQMHRYKTGALIEASVVMGAMSVGATLDQMGALKTYAKAIGLAFQIQDDILDVTANTEELGKQQGADAAQNKPTYVSLLGLEAAQEKARALVDDAQAALATFTSADVLNDLARYIISRGS